MNRVVARGQDIGKRGGVGFKSGAESWEQQVGAGRIDSVCVLYVSVLFVFVLSLVYSVLSVHSQSPEVSTSLLGKK